MQKGVHFICEVNPFPFTEKIKTSYGKITIGGFCFDNKRTKIKAIQKR